MVKYAHLLMPKVTLMFLFSYSQKSSNAENELKSLSQLHRSRSSYGILSIMWIFAAKQPIFALIAHEAYPTMVIIMCSGQ